MGGREGKEVGKRRIKYTSEKRNWSEIEGE